MKFNLLIGSLFMILCASHANDTEAKFVWAHEDGQVRNEYVYFRNEFTLNNEPDEATIHLYADSRYQLFVNDIYINFGPARSYPQNPEYDTHDISPYLSSGHNVIAVKTLYNGIENFQVPENRPGFIAWGRVKTANKEIGLETPGHWLCRKSEGYDQNAVRFSFACAAMEVFDARKENYDWKAANLDMSEWKNTVLLEDQNAWGDLSTRSIPHLTREEREVKYLIGAYELNREEDIYSFRIKTPDEKRSDYNKGPSILAYTYIYSPVEQLVVAGLWWGEFYLNGEGPLKGSGENPNRINRDPRILRLKKGWNFLNIHYGAVWGAWDFYMALPKSADLLVSPTKEKNSEYIFMTKGPLPWEENQKLRRFNKPFNSHDEMLSLVGEDWTGQVRSAETNNPALDMVWYFADKKLDFPAWKTKDIQINKGPGTAIVFDIGKKTLGRLFIDFEAPVGTRIDLGFSEDLYDGKPWLFKRKMISAAVRCIADGKIQRFETFKPYGLRYLQVNITQNNGPVIIKKLGTIGQVYPFKKRGFFECSDPMFNDIWELGWRTLRVCAEDSYTDTPFRERGLYAGDMLPEYAITLAGSGDSRLLKRSLNVFHDKYHSVMYENDAAPNGEFPLINVITSKWYYDYTGDREFVAAIYDGYKNLMDRWLETEDAKGHFFRGKQFIEWTKIDKSAKLTATHALLSRALAIVAEYADILQKPKEAAYYLQNSVNLADHIRNSFWDEDRQLFNDGFKDGRLTGAYYPTSNAWPLLYGCTDKKQTVRIIDYLENQFTDIGEESRNRRITPYSSFYALAALYQQGRSDIAERFIRQYWTRMILNGSDTSWENFDVRGEHDGGGQGTASHAWSGHPTYFLSTEALGVNLGFHKPMDRDTIMITPQSESLIWAKGVVPHPTGLVSVHWRVEGEMLFLEYTAPKSIPVIVKPRGRLSEKTLWVNGKKAN